MSWLTRNGETFNVRCEQCSFVSRGWPDKDKAVLRYEEHLLEHESGKPAPELVESGAR